MAAQAERGKGRTGGRERWRDGGQAGRVRMVSRRITRFPS